METVRTQGSPSQTIPFGLFELDPAGIVIRYSPAAERNDPVLQQNILGRDFFTEIAPVEQVKDFRDRFHVFMAHGESVQKFTSTLSLDHGQIRVQILLARITEQSEQGRKRLALVHIRPLIEQIAA
jgi:photoactive yellow protein